MVTARSNNIYMRSILVLAIAAAGLGHRAGAQTLTYHYEYAGTLGSGTSITSLKGAFFGEEVSYIEGQTRFSVVDVDIPSNSQLPLRFGRRWEPYSEDVGVTISGDAVFKVLGSKWAIDIPVIQGIYRKQDGFVTGAAPRCSTGKVAPDAIPYPGGPSIVPYNFWYGLKAKIPGYGEGKIYPLNSGDVVPDDGVTYKFALQKNWRVSCLPALQNGVGEGFIVALPDGVKYYFDWTSSRPTKKFTTPYMDHERVEFTLHATRAIDRFGNTVNYTYDPSFPHRLTKISDGKGGDIDVQYSGNNISSVSAGGRTWTYSYDVSSSGLVTLSSVMLPDSSSWRYEQPYIVSGVSQSPFPYKCDYSPGGYTSAGDSIVTRLAITHPSGARGEFDVKTIAHGYNNVPLGQCTVNGDQSTSLFGRPKAHLVGSLVRKRVSGVGISPVDTYIDYAPSWSFESECSGGCARSSRTTLTHSDGSQEVYEYGNDFQTNANQLISHSLYKNGTLVRRTQHSYLLSSEGQPFPDYAVGRTGEEGGLSLDNPFLRRNRPLVESTVEQDGTRFESKVAGFDRFVRPVTEVKQSSAL